MLNTCTVHTHQNVWKYCEARTHKFRMNCATPPPRCVACIRTTFYDSWSRMLLNFKLKSDIIASVACLGKYIDIKLRGFHQIKYWVAGFERLNTIKLWGKYIFICCIWNCLVDGSLLSTSHIYLAMGIHCYQTPRISHQIKRWVGGF